MNHRTFVRFNRATEQLPLLALRRVIEALIRRTRRWQRLAYERRLLASLDDRMLRDIGISRADAELESQRPFWREVSRVRQDQ